MVIRYYVKCSTCSTAHTLRISVGDNPLQSHTFQCIECKEPITVEMEVDFDKIETTLKCVDGCEEHDQEGTIVNLNPHFAVPEEHQHDQSFPWLKDLLEVAHKQEELSGESSIKPTSIEDLQDLNKKILRTTDGWAIIKKAWSLSINGKDELARKAIAKYEDIGFTSTEKLNEVLFAFFQKFIHPVGFKLFEGACDILKIVVKGNRTEFERFKKYYLETFYKDQMKNYFDIFTDYFRDFSEYNQTLTYVKYGIPLPENHQATSTAFKRTKMFYGNVFELMTRHFVVLACLNNIHSGRNSEQFEKMDLKKYLTINKTNRANPFKETSELYNFSECLESTLRNASHHGAIKLENNIVSYRSGGTGAMHSMTYAQYLLKCNEATFAMIALLLFELEIAC